MPISNKMTIIGLVNGMIGGIILVMPILALKTGWLLIAPITIIMGFFSYFSCLLCLRHLQNFKDLDQAIFYHFGKKKIYKVLYDCIIIISMTTLLILYFSLICEQWIGIIGHSKLIPILNALVLFPIVYIMKRYDFGASLLAYGILSIVGYILFLTFLTLTTESGPKEIPATHKDFVDLTAALAQGLAIQTFFIPILRKNENRHLYKKLLRITYVIGTIIYCYIGYAGAYSILLLIFIGFVNRKPFSQPPQTIEDFFGSGQNWVVILVQIIYLIHLYSAFPQFLLIAKQRCFSIFKWPQPKNVSIKQIIYVAITIFISLLVKLTQLKVTIIIELNGSVISFFFIYVIPIGLHLKCVYFTKEEDRHDMLNEQKQQQGQDNQQQEKQQNPSDAKQAIAIQSSDDGKQARSIEMKQKNSSSSQNKSENSENYNSQGINQGVIQQEISKKQSLSQFYRSSLPQPINNQLNNTVEPEPMNAPQSSNNSCGCDIKFSSKIHEYGQLFVMGTMVLLGILTMIYTLYLLGTQKDEQNTTGGQS